MGGPWCHDSTCQKFWPSKAGAGVREEDQKCAPGRGSTVESQVGRDQGILKKWESQKPVWENGEM